jgi:CxxC-x17-CxxC domain-containing protein
MARFENSRERRGPSGRPSSRGARPRRSFEGGQRGDRDSDRSKREFGMTKVTCSTCKKECEVPFKPTSNKPVYCDKCFSKRDRTSTDKAPSKDLDIINEKLNKIMKALEIK